MVTEREADSRFGPWYLARDAMRRALESDLMGGAADQLLDERPLDRFIVGVLHPREASSSFTEEELDLPESGDSGGPDAVFDPAVALSHVRFPSSMGLTFAVDVRDTRTVRVGVDATRYLPVAVEDTVPDRYEVRHRRGHSGASTRWRRTPLEIPPLTVDVRASGATRHEVTDGLGLRVVVRQPVASVVSVTVVLVNEFTVDRNSDRDLFCWFQPRLRLTTTEGGFVDRPGMRPTGVDDEDLDSYAVLYRGVRNLAVGHGCAVNWTDGNEVDALETTFIPRHDLLLSKPRTADGLGMRELADSSDVGSLRALLDSYREWISHREDELDELAGALRATGRRHLDSATAAALRIEQGIKLIEQDADAARAFRLMNAAMHEQRTRQEILRGRDPALAAATPHVWRPFQIAFILLNLPGLSDPQSPDRDIADLLWFPTGGGKTEAYLGLIAYTILLRRLRDPSDGGVSVIMRYTLRLLTVQQFERAAGLICALEVQRKEQQPEAAPIELGLWVGQATTPNTVKEAQKALRQLRRGEEAESGNPMQLLRCPWCGTDLGPDDYRVDKAATRMTVRCAMATCAFSNGLPVHLVDEDIYRERPSLVIGTVDKFAMMAWLEQVGSLFSSDGRYPPPDLIVQDELHLISGPLGTMVGLYETAVDAACQRGAARPKIVASTATIRRARKQVAAVFDRSAEQFPPPGLESGDSFFSVDASPVEKGTRQYVGVLAPGVSQATLLVRSYAALLQAARDLDVDDEIRDAYWTLLGYFNSLRVLGGAFMQVIDDVPDRLKVVAERFGEEPRPLTEPREMTSRKRSSEIPTELALLGTSYPDPASPDVVLATNMISVGVDVDRLGLMVVAGQPQTTAEYIQATSRVGREHPGLVVVLYNGARSRDLSHYESFTSYHRGLYRQVEATGATPFAARARDRGLHGVLVSMARLLISEAAADSSAGTVDRWEPELRRVAAQIVARAQRVSRGDADATARQLAVLIEAWLDAARDRNLKYAGWRDSSGALLTGVGLAVTDEGLSFPVDEPPWVTLTSLRDVDTESSLHLVAGRRR